MQTRDLDLLRRDALAQRLKGIGGGKRIHWTATHRKLLSDSIMSAPASAFRGTDEKKKYASRSSLSELRVKLLADGTLTAVKDGSSSAYTFVINSDSVDLEGDVIPPKAIDLSIFARNPVVTLSHDTQSPPIATSSLPRVIGNSLVADASFPAPGVSARSDEVRALVGGGHLKGASIGFIPVKFAISKDPDRQFGLNFSEVRLLEFAICSVPCNSDCLLIGAAATSRSARSFAGRSGTCGRSWDAKCGLLNPSECGTHCTSQTQTRSERMEEAARIRRSLGGL